MNVDDGHIANDLCKTDAIILAHNMNHKNQEPAYAVETRYGWTCSTRKPSLRFGKVIECHNGKESWACDDCAFCQDCEQRAIKPLEAKNEL